MDKLENQKKKKLNKGKCNTLKKEENFGLMKRIPHKNISMVSVSKWYAVANKHHAKWAIHLSFLNLNPTQESFILSFREIK